MKQKIVAIVGSLRRESLNLKLAQATKNLLLEQVDFEILEYHDVPLFNQDIEYPAPLAVQKVREIVKSADAVWFFCPEYNHFFPGVLKNLIDWLSRPISETEPQVLKRKYAAVCGITPGMTGTVIAMDHLVTLLSFLDMKLMNQPRLPIPNGYQQVTENGNLELTHSLPFLEKMAEEFLKFITIPVGN